MHDMVAATRQMLDNVILNQVRCGVKSSLSVHDQHEWNVGKIHSWAKFVRSSSFACFSSVCVYGSGHKQEENPSMARQPCLNTDIIVPL